MEIDTSYIDDDLKNISLQLDDKFNHLKRNSTKLDNITTSLYKMRDTSINMRQLVEQEHIKMICDKYLNSDKLDKLDISSLVNDREILDKYYTQSVIKNQESLKEKIQETLQIINKKLIQNYTN